MRSGAAAGRDGYFHETAFYQSDDELLDVVMPFLTGGLEAGEPTVVAFAEKNQRLVRAVMPDCSGITFLPGATQHAKPASAIRRYRQLLADFTQAGAHQIRVVGEVPHPGTGAPWDWWARYEAAINYAFDEFPIWGICPYDTRITPDHVLDDVARTHPYIATVGDRHDRNDRYGDPTALLTRPAAAKDVLEFLPPVAELVSPTPAAARQAVLAASRATCLDAIEVDDLVFAASEAVTNGICYGQPPVRFRLWADVDRMVVTVTDGGPGATGPLVGLLPTEGSASAGLGLWIAHNTCSYVGLDRGEDGFTVRIVMGPPKLTT